MIRRALLTLFLLVVVLYTIKQPVSAAHTATLLGHAIAATARALGRFASVL